MPRRLVHSLGFLFTLTASLAIPGVARAMCGGGGNLVSSGQTVSEVVFLNNGNAVVGGINFNYAATTNTPSNCMVNAHINIPGVGASAGGSSYGFGEWYVVEIGAATLYGDPPIPLLDSVSLEVTTSSLATVPSFPQVGTLEFWYSTNEFCNVKSWSGFMASGCAVFLARVPVYVEDVAVISMIPVLFR